MTARSSLLRRSIPGARPARRTSSVVAALAALAPRLVRLAHHDYRDGLLAPVRTAAVVVTWEGGATTDRCVASVLAQDRPPDEVIVVDNASSPPERARLGAAHGGRPGVRLLLLDENRQFAGGLNAGATTAIAAGAERLLLLNNDTVLAPDALGRLAAALEPRAVAFHDGLRGFAGGLTPWAAFLKARNPWLVVRRRGSVATWLGFVPTYAAMLGGSAALHALRGRGDVVRALARGALAGIGAAAGRRVAPVGPPAGSR